jgi:hypothetical protein
MAQWILICVLEDKFASLSSGDFAFNLVRSDSMSSFAIYLRVDLFGLSSLKELVVHG